MNDQAVNEADSTSVSQRMMHTKCSLGEDGYTHTSSRIKDLEQEIRDYPSRTQHWDQTRKNNGPT